MARGARVRRACQAGGRRRARPRAVFGAAAAAAAAIGLAFTAPPPCAAAEPSATEVAHARQLFAQASADEDNRRWKDAIAKLEQAAAIKDTPGLRFHLGHCNEQLGLLVEALVEFERADEALRAGAQCADLAHAADDADASRTIARWGFAGAAAGAVALAGTWLLWPAEPKSARGTGAAPVAVRGGALIGVHGRSDAAGGARRRSDMSVKHASWAGSVVAALAAACGTPESTCERTLTCPAGPALDAAPEDGVADLSASDAGPQADAKPDGDAVKDPTTDTPADLWAGPDADGAFDAAETVDVGDVPPEGSGDVAASEPDGAGGSEATADAVVEPDGGDAAGGTDGAEAGDGGCGPAKKPCANQCVPDDQPATGCAQPSCSPCGATNGTPSCAGGACKIACKSGWGDCDGQNANGCETDLSVHPSHCGYCGHDCLGGPCQAGACLPKVIASGQNKPYGISAASGYVYWTNQGDGGTVNRVSIVGGPFFVLALGQVTPWLLAVDATSVYWTVAAGNPAVRAVRKVATSGGVAADLYSDPTEFPVGIDVRGSSVYWTHGLPGFAAVRRAAVTGGAFTTLVSSQAQATSVVTDDTHVYWCGSGIVGKVAQDGGGMVPIAGDTGAQSIAVLQSNVYWTVWGTPGALKKTPLSGSPVSDVTTGLDEPGFLAIDSSGAYVTSRGPGKVTRVPLTGGQSILLSSGQAGPVGIAVDSTSVYWANYDGGTIMRLAKP